MSKEELIALLQEKGLSDDDIKALLGEALEVINKDEAQADEKIDEHKEEEIDEEQKMKDVFGI